MVEQIAAKLIEHLADPMTSLLGIGFVYLLALIRKWAKDGIARKAVDYVYNVAKVVVADVYQTYVRELKARADDGKLTSDEQKEAFARAMSKLKSYLGVKGMTVLADNLGLGGTGIDQFLGSMIEKALLDTKTEATAAKKLNG